MRQQAPIQPERPRSAHEQSLALPDIDFEYQWKVPAYALEFVIDVLFLPLVALTILLRPWYARHYLNIIDS